MYDGLPNMINLHTCIYIYAMHLCIYMIYGIIIMKCITIIIIFEVKEFCFSTLLHFLIYVTSVGKYFCYIIMSDL